MNRVYGIDLGTTYSCIAYVDEFNNPKVIENMDGQFTTPSVVFFEGDNIVVGEQAKNYARLSADRVVESIKREMGNDFKVSIDDKEYRPEEISALILRKLVQDAETQVGPIKDVVITCPAYFNVGEREATKMAGTIAGLNVLEILNEPTAAAIAYGFRTQEDGTVVIYDLGGGTFDVTVIQIKNGEYRVIATDGDRELGGKDWDAKIVNYLIQEWETQNGQEIDPTDLQLQQDLYTAAESLKKSLSQRNEVTQVVRYNNLSAKVMLSREKFEDLTKDLLELTIKRTAHALSEAAERGVTGFDKFLLVGGSSKMPRVIERIRQEFGIEPEFNRPDFAVAEGAAFHGYIKFLQGEVDKIIQEQSVDDQAARDRVASQFGLSPSSVEKLHNVRIINITSHSFGIEVITNDGEKKLANMIVSGTEVPTSITRSDFGTHLANQANLDVRIHENSNRESIIDIPEDGLLGTAVMELPENLPAGSQVEITFDLDSSGLLNVRAILAHDQREVSTAIQTEHIMTKEQLAEAIERSRGLTILS